tara:strand:- start:4225 stop:4425 length:201 start_codon:yes stop_codon:yes gene_type:complete
MSEGSARLGLFLDTLIIVIPVLIIGFIAEKGYKKVTNKDVPDNYYTYVVGAAFVIYILLRNILRNM